MQIEHSIYINATPGIVWRITVDIEKWPEWSPTMDSVTRVDEGAFGVGSVTRIKQPMQSEAEWVVTKFEKGKLFSWESRRPGLQMTATHEIYSEGIIILETK